MNRFTFGQNSLQKDAGPCNSLQRFRLSNFDNIKRFLKHKVSQSKDCVDRGVRVLVDQSLKPGRDVEGVTVGVIRIVSKENVRTRWKLSLPVTHGVRVDSEAFNVAHVGLQLGWLISFTFIYFVSFSLYHMYPCYVLHIIGMLCTCDW